MRRRRDTNVSGEDPLPPGGALLASIPAIMVFDGPLTLASHLIFHYRKEGPCSTLDLVVTNADFDHTPDGRFCGTCSGSS